MSSRTFSPGQATAIREARDDYRHARAAGRRVDVVDVACETANYWWARLSDRGARIAGRYIAWGIAPLED
jgi:hypothetical protein